MNKINEFFRTMKRLKGKEFWGGGGSANTGSMLDINFGAKISKIVRSKGKEKLIYEGEFILYIECCSWRLISDKGILSSNFDEINKINAGINKILNTEVIEVKLVKKTFDLDIQFSNNHNFQIFCNQTDEENDMDNYSLFHGEDIYVIGPNLVFKHETRAF